MGSGCECEFSKTEGACPTASTNWRLQTHDKVPNVFDELQKKYCENGGENCPTYRFLRDRNGK
jgi:hypothetical protein